jgi:maltose O-acetyltransferase
MGPSVHIYCATHSVHVDERLAGYERAYPVEVCSLRFPFVRFTCSPLSPTAQIGDDVWVGGQVVIIGPSKIGKSAFSHRFLLFLICVELTVFLPSFPPCASSFAFYRAPPCPASDVTIAAGSVVKGDFPDNVVIGGTPARVLKHLDPPTGPISATDKRLVVPLPGTEKSKAHNELKKQG